MCGGGELINLRLTAPWEKNVPARTFIASSSPVAVRRSHLLFLFPQQTALRSSGSYMTCSDVLSNFLRLDLVTSYV